MVCKVAHSPGAHQLLYKLVYRFLPPPGMARWRKTPARRACWTHLGSGREGRREMEAVRGERSGAGGSPWWVLLSLLLGKDK